MKLLVRILSIYILVLSAISCLDAPRDNIAHKTELSQNTTDNHSNDIDFCSPFCVCDCCVSPIISQIVFFHFSSFLFSQERIYLAFKSACISSNLTTVWQPPKLS